MAFCFVGSSAACHISTSRASSSDIAGDLDCAGEVTLDDFAGFASSLGGPDATTACSAFDVDHDTDVDLVNYPEMQRVFRAAP